MKKIWFVLPCLYTLWCGCFNDASDPDTDPPEIESMVPETLSVTDTLIIAFSEEIDTSDFEVNSSTVDLNYAFDGEKKLLIYGSETHFGMNHFTPDLALTLEFEDFKDLVEMSKIMGILSQ